jgi:hypothetical protein
VVVFGSVAHNADTFSAATDTSFLSGSAIIENAPAKNRVVATGWQSINA